MGDPILVVGEALIDVVRRTDGSVEEHAGGSPANVALGLARLGHDVLFATSIGDDPRGRVISDLMRDNQVTLTADSVTSTPTSVAEATLDHTGAASYHFELSWVLPARLPTDGVTHVHTGSISATLQPGATTVRETFQRARESATLSYDPNARPSLMGSPADVRGQIEGLIGLADVVKASDEDVAWLYDGATVPEVMRLWSRLGPRVVVVTRGGAGAVAVVGSEAIALNAPPTRVADTVGAGDSFMSGLLSGLLDAGLLGGPGARNRLAAAGLAEVRPALDRALACGAITVSRPGADPPTRAELEEVTAHG
ncbi:MAG TPA: PfkB family carbohydrate kinase [Dermatophilaceae bacterium]|nr:PfkB family carbohydrate kinase [Dermatophilaceae bacterium]